MDGFISMLYLNFDIVAHYGDFFLHYIFPVFILAFICSIPCFIRMLWR